MQTVGDGELPCLLDLLSDLTLGPTAIGETLRPRASGGHGGPLVSVRSGCGKPLWTDRVVGGKGGIRYY